MWIFLLRIKSEEKGIIYVEDKNVENQSGVATPMKVKKHLQHFVIEKVEIYRNNLFILL